MRKMGGPGAIRKSSSERTERTAAQIVNDLGQAGYLTKTRDRRRLICLKLLQPQASIVLGVLRRRSPPGGVRQPERASPLDDSLRPAIAFSDGLGDLAALRAPEAVQKRLARTS